MSDLKHYIIIDLLNKYYPYHVEDGTFSSNIGRATQRTYEDSEKMCEYIYFHRPHVIRKCVIENIRKIKLEMLNKI